MYPESYVLRSPLYVPYDLPSVFSHLVVADAYLVRVPESHNAALDAATTTNDANVQEEGKGYTEDVSALSGAGAGRVDRPRNLSRGSSEARVWFCRHTCYVRWRCAIFF